MDAFAYIGREPDIPYHYYIFAQEFIPTKNILTRVKLMVSKDVTTTYDLTLAIRDNLTEPDLTSIIKNHDSIPSENFSWIEFDFENIKVTPGFRYYIVCSTNDASDNRYAWGVKITDAYPNGTILWSEDGQKWYYDPGVDTTFKTYGWDNHPPSAPIIDGPTSGKVGVEYEYNFSLSDPENDSMYLRVDWGSGTPGPWHGPFNSGKTVRLNHTWNQKGSFTIRAQATDVYDAQSNWGTLKVTMPKNQQTDNFWSFRFLERFPNAFPRRFLQLLAKN